MLIGFHVAFSQTDSLAVVQADWFSTKISRGVVLKRAAFAKSLFGSNQYISILEVKQKRRLALDLAYEESLLRSTSDFGQSNKALAAINGTFFDVAKGGSVDYIRSDGMIISTNRLNKTNQRAVHQKGAVVLQHGKLDILKWDGSPDWENKIEAEDVMLSGPILLLNKQPELLDSASFNTTRHPRSVIAKGKGKKVYFIVIDGRRELAAGMSLFEVQNLLKWLKYSDGINLDGGGSSALWVDGQNFNGVVSYPSDNKKWDHEGQRKVANAILLKKK
ncbi:hypothetical protein ADIARSV_4078 [Arcticibacter svalbardensis MN12-7]|uniref:Phosphodiester glycosidase domain-containing protein n=1 Tax=Arcticibacter svalbardensis MN12-7 TaxID=1150600 RepID=R9GM79_9SPHI|nr:phosphodiester glycosidase family protein [Arcticibacter svalbardensis]EOR92796.1 hypothetical protein ADIARSV_4078 [Arcticibacter svalbardensis MN12-7]